MDRRRLALMLAAVAVFSAALIAASLVASRGESAPTMTAPASPAPSSFAGIPQRGAALGDPNAKVTLVEYADLQCPYCARWSTQTLPVLVDEYVRTGKVRVVFRGLAFLGPDSVRALRVTLAAGRQNRLWDVIEGLYYRQGARTAAGSPRQCSTRSPGSEPLTGAARGGSIGRS